MHHAIRDSLDIVLACSEGCVPQEFKLYFNQFTKNNEQVFTISKTLHTAEILYLFTPSVLYLHVRHTKK